LKCDELYEYPCVGGDFYFASHSCLPAEVVRCDAPIERNAAGAIDSAAVQMRRLQIETRRWILSKLLPRKYGDRMGLDHQGEGFNLTVVTGVPESFASLEQKRLKIG